VKLACIISAALCCAIAQAAQIESSQDLVARLTPQQKQQFDAASQAFNSQHYADALAGFKALLQELPGDPVLSKFTAESALNSADGKFALDILQPVAQSNPDDWQAAALLARAYAATGDNKARDAAMAHMLELHQKGVTPSNMQAYILERIKLGDNTLLIRPSLVPWGPYKVYFLGQLLNAQGEIFLRMTLESSDSDQILFAQQHPKEAAAGLRLFSMDGYQQTGPNTQTHMTFGFYTGEPSYDVVREKFLAIAEKKQTPISSRSGLPVH
jgi:tetratricopeptide (TPR) repeat protein